MIAERRVNTIVMLRLVASGQTTEVSWSSMVYMLTFYMIPESKHRIPVEGFITRGEHRRAMIHTCVYSDLPKQRFVKDFMRDN